MAFAFSLDLGSWIWVAVRVTTPLILPAEFRLVAT
jgi:hypothetical protein